MSEFKPIETQEAFDAAIKDRLERAKKTVTDEVKKQYEGWISPDDAKKSADRITELTQQVTDLTAKNAIYRDDLGWLFEDLVVYSLKYVSLAALAHHKKGIVYVSVTVWSATECFFTKTERAERLVSFYAKLVSCHYSLLSLFDYSAADDSLAVVKHERLARGYSALRLIEA